MTAPSTPELLAWAGLFVWCAFALAFVFFGAASNRKAGSSESQMARADQDESDRKPGDGF
jgi:hypothetical protein